MSSLSGAKNLTETELRLKQLRKQLSTITLLGQLPLDDEDIGVLREVIKREIDASTSDRSRLRNEGHLSLSCFLVWMGIEHYDQGTYWAKVEGNLGRQGAIWQRRWGEIFLDTLERYDLTAFDSRGHKYVTPILLHGGVPDRCLPDFFRNVLYPIVNGAMDADVDAEELLIEWRSKPSLYLTTDVPVRRFLEEGGRPSADFLDRCVEMARIAYYGEEIPSAEELGLPDRVVEKFRRWWSVGLPLSMGGRRVVLSRPRIELDAYCGEVRCLLPEQRILQESEYPVLLQVTADEKRICSSEVVSYAKSNGIITEPTVCAVPPARKYSVRLSQRPELSREWSFDGLGSDGWIAFDTERSLLSGTDLPRGVFWIAFDSGARLDESVRLIELSEGTDQWDGYRFSLIDTSDAESPELIREGEKRVLLPLARGKAPKICGELVAGCSVNGISVYTGRLPTLQVPLSQPEEIDGWDLIVEDLTTDVPLRRYAALKDVVAEIDGGNGIAQLSNIALLGDSILGVYRVKLRSRGALGLNKQFQFAFVRDLQYDFDQTLFLSNEPARLTLMTGRDLRVSSEETTTQIKAIEGVALIAAEVHGRFLHLNIEENSRRRLDIIFAIPRLRWTVLGLSNDSVAKWQSEAIDVQLEDLESMNEVTLIVQLPLGSGELCAIELEDVSHRSDERVRNGEVRFRLSTFADSLRSLPQHRELLRLTFNDAANVPREFYPVCLITRWSVEKLEHCYSTQVSLATLSCHWGDSNAFRDRCVRIWDLWQVWKSPWIIPIADGLSEMTAQEDRSVLHCGDYRLEFFNESEYAEESPTSPPAKNTHNVFEIHLGSHDEQTDYVRRLPRSFLGYLTTVLAGQETSYRTSTNSLSESEITSLFRTLGYLIQEGQRPKATRICLELRRSLDVKSVTELSSRILERFSDSTKPEIKESLGLITSLGVRVGSKIRLGNQVVQIEDTNGDWVKVRFADRVDKGNKLYRAKWINLATTNQMVPAADTERLTGDRDDEEEKVAKRRGVR